MAKPKKDYQPLTVQLEPADRERLQERAQAGERTLAAEVRLAIKKHLASDPLYNQLLKERYK